MSDAIERNIIMRARGLIPMIAVTLSGMVGYSASSYRPDRLRYDSYESVVWGNLYAQSVYICQMTISPDSIKLFDFRKSLGIDSPIVIPIKESCNGME